MIVARALKNGQLIRGERHAYFGDGTLAQSLRIDFALDFFQIQTRILSSLVLVRSTVDRQSGSPYW